MPTMNPDGFEYEYKQKIHALGQGRSNANNVDLNRNFPKVEFQPSNDQDKKGIFVPKQPIDSNKSYLEELTKIQKQFEPEVRAVMHWSIIHPFVLSANLHGGALVANYPFDSGIANTKSKEVKSPDDATFKMLAKAYSYVSYSSLFISKTLINFTFKAHPKMHLGNACVRFKDGITNGADWYVIDGGMQDWSYAYTSDMEITIELGCEKYPDESSLKSYWNDNKGALLVYMTQVMIEFESSKRIMIVFEI